MVALKFDLCGNSVNYFTKKLSLKNDIIKMCRTSCTHSMYVDLQCISKIQGWEVIRYL